MVYINVGANRGVNVGDMLSVVRPRGQVKTRWTRKGDLGFYVQEVGALEVIRVKNEVSVARVKMSCDNFLLGDLVQRGGRLFFTHDPEVALGKVVKDDKGRFHTVDEQRELRALDS